MKPVDPVQVITEHQGAIYNYVRRVLPSDSDASDVTQEVFASALASLHRYDASRPILPWIHGIAAHAIARYFRDRKTRTQKERQAAMQKTEASFDRRPEEQDERQVIQAHLEELPLPARELLVLRYYNGLTQNDVAEALGVPRTTVRDRLATALGQLKTRLHAGGFAAIVPQLEHFMETTPPMAMPSQLCAALQHTAGGHVLSQAGAGLTFGIGGIVVTKHVITIVAIGMFALVGWSVGRQPLAAELRLAQAGQQSVAEELQATEEARDRLRAANEKLEGELEALQATRAALAAQLATAREATAIVAASASEDEPPQSLTLGVDWEELTQLFADRADALVELGRTAAAGERLSPAQKALWQEILLAVNRAANLVKQEVPYPLMNDEVIARVLEAIPGALIDLTDAQQRQLSSVADAFLASQPEVDDRTTPLEVYDVRHKLFANLDQTIDAFLTEDQSERWGYLAPLWNGLSEGNRHRRTYGLQLDGLSDRLVDEWSAHYRIPEEQRQRLAPYARQMREEVGSIVERFGLEGKSLDSLDPATFSAVTNAFLAVQLRIEQEFTAGLDDASLRRLHGIPPLVFWFEDTKSRLYNNVEDRGF